MPPNKKEAVIAFINVLKALDDNGELTEEMKREALAVLSSAVDSLTQEPRTKSVSINDPEGAELLWTLAGGDPETFVKYLQTVPDDSLDDLKNDPEKLAATIDILSSIGPKPPIEKEGVESSQLESSNIYGFKYDPKSRKLIVKFQGNKGYGQGPIYEYSKVPKFIYDLFKDGAISAKTTGKNKWGRWWKHKNPSLGATHYSLIRDTFPYKKVS